MRGVDIEDARSGFSTFAKAESMTPILEIAIGEERWGLTYDDHCVVVMRRAIEDGKWEPWKSAWVPYAVAIHVSALALSHEVYSTGLDAAHAVVRGYIDGGKLKAS